MNDDHDDVDKQVTPQTPIKLIYAEKWQCSWFALHTFTVNVWRKTEIFTCDRWAHAHVLEWEGCLLHVRYEQREDVLLRRERSAHCFQEALEPSLILWHTDPLPLSSKAQTHSRRHQLAEYMAANVSEMFWGQQPEPP